MGGGTHKWDTSQVTMAVVGRHDFVQPEAAQVAMFDVAPKVYRRYKLARPQLEVELSSGSSILVWAADMRLDGRARRNRVMAKVENMKRRRREKRMRKAKR